MTVRLRDIMATEVVSVDPGVTLRELAEILVARQISGAPVVAGSRIVGVVSSTDLLDFECSAPGTPRHREVPLERADWDEPNEWEPDDDPPALYFTEFWEDVGADVLERFEEPDGPEWNRLEECTVADVMTTDVVSLGPDVSVTEAAEFMLRHEVHRVLVVEAGGLVGLVSTTDIVRAVAERGLAA